MNIRRLCSTGASRPSFWLREMIVIYLQLWVQWLQVGSMYKYGGSIYTTWIGKCYIRLLPSESQLLNIYQHIFCVDTQYKWRHQYKSQIQRTCVMEADTRNTRKRIALMRTPIIHIGAYHLQGTLIFIFYLPFSFVKYNCYLIKKRLIPWRERASWEEHSIQKACQVQRSWGEGVGGSLVWLRSAKRS